MKSKITTAFLVCILLVGVALFFTNPIQNKLIETRTEQLLEKPITFETKNATAAELEERSFRVSNIKEVESIEASFDFEAVKSITVADVIEAQLKKVDTPVISQIFIPSVNLKLPIGKGVSESVILYGAGTMKPDQQLGEGNYALASHYIEGRNILFGPLYHVKMGDRIFVNDGQYKYEYAVTVKDVILETDVQVIEDVPGETLITLITCAEKGSKRLLVQGVFVGKFPLN